MRHIICTGLLTFAMIFTACNKQQGEANKEPNDINKNTVEEAKQANENNETVKPGCSEFVVEAAQHNKMELELSKIGSERASSKEVKVLAQQLMGDHSKAEAELGSIAEKKSIKLATENTKKHSSSADMLANKKGEDFDRSYLESVINMHEDAVKKFEDAAEDCEDAEIRSFASTNLPVLRKHLEMAKTMNESLKKRSKETYTNEKAPEGPH